MTPKQLLERAAYAFLTNLETPISGIASTSIYKGTRNPTSVENEENTGEVSQKVHPSVTVEADGGHEEAVFGTRIFQGVLSVTVEVDAHTTTDDEFHTICSEAFSKFNIRELATNMSSGTTGFTMIQGRISDISDTINNGQNWMKILRLVCVYGAADL
jgi:hypothetical protein